jgi:hypothetical protein
MFSRELPILMLLPEQIIPMLSRDLPVPTFLQGQIIPMLNREPMVHSPSNVQPTHRANETPNRRKQAVFIRREVLLAFSLLFFLLAWR